MLDKVMKELEHRHRRKLSPKDYVLIRIDGRAFHSFTRGLDKPFDLDLRSTMIHTAVALCENIQGVRLAYTQSDEISLLITAWKDPSEDNSKSQLPFGGVEAKLVSLSASIATAAFNSKWAEIGRNDKTAQFDSRVWTFPGTDEGLKLVLDYFKWRQKDAEANSVSMKAQSHFSHKMLHGVGVKKMKALLDEAGDPWEEEDGQNKYGTLVHKSQTFNAVAFTHGRTGEKVNATVRRSIWKASEASSVTDWMCVFHQYTPPPLNEEPVSTTRRIEPWYDLRSSLSRAYAGTLLHWADNLNSYPPDSSPGEWAEVLRGKANVLLKWLEDDEDPALYREAQDVFRWTADNLDTLWD